METSIGDYIDERTGKHYEVIQRTQINEYQTLQGVKKSKGPVEYYTYCGIDLNPLDDTNERFEMIQMDGTIKKIDI